MLKKHVVAALLALVSALPGAGLAATYTALFSVTPAAFVDLGAAPVDVTINTNAQITFVVADTQPAAGTPGATSVGGQSQKITFCQTSHVWAQRTDLGPYSSSAAVLAVTPSTACAPPTQPVSGSVTSNDGGAAGTGISPPAGASGVTGWLSGIYQKLTGSIAVTGTFWQATQPVSGTVTSNDGGAAGTGISPPAGGSGLSGWLSGIYQKLTGSIAVTGTFWQATQPVSGQVGGLTKPVCVIPTMTASTYAVKQPIGGVLSFANAFGSGTTGTIESIAINSKTVQTVGLTFYPMISAPGTPGNLGDHATANITGADAFLVRAPTQFNNPLSDLGTHTAWGVTGLGQTIGATSSTLYGVLVAQATTAAFGSTSDIEICVKVLSDQ